MPESTRPLQTDEDAALDVFAAARWFKTMWNSTAAAVSPDEIEWQCCTWGSGRGAGDWVETAVFALVTEVFGLRSWRHHEGRDELVVLVPLGKVAEIRRLLSDLGDDPESWPWFGEEDPDHQVALAAAALGMPVETVAKSDELLEALRIL